MLRTVAAGAIGFGAAAAAPDFSIAQTVVPPAGGPCVITGTTVTCTGDVSAGVVVNGPTVDTLNINNVDAPGIAPAAGVSGIIFTTPDGNNVMIDVDTTGTGGIVTDQDGIYGVVTGDGNVSIANRGNITSTAEEGIDAEIAGSGNINIMTTGNITSDDESIDATVGNNGNIDIINIGTLISNDGYGIDAVVVNNGNVQITNSGNINSYEDGIYGFVGGNGNIGIANSSIINSQFGFGIDSYLTGNGNNTIINSANVTSYFDSIRSLLAGNGDVTISNTGNLNSTDGAGVVGAIQFDGNVVINSIGNIASYFPGIVGYVGGNGNIAVTSTGDIISQFGDGINSYVFGNGDISVASNGDITTMADDTYGIFAQRVFGNGNISVSSNGNINTMGTSADGIFAEQAVGNGDISVTSNGTINATNGTGIVVDHDGMGVIDINTSGMVTATTGIVVQIRNMMAASTINNSGVITGTSGFAINLGGDGNDVVNLLPGSVMNGAIDFGNGNGTGPGGTPGNLNDIDTLNFAAGLNAVVNFADTGGVGQGDTDPQSAPEIINFAGGGVVINGGLTAVAVDATGFTAQGTFISDLTDAIFNSIDNGGTQQGSGINPQETLGFGPIGDEDAEGSIRLWGSVFGGYHDVDGTSNLAHFDHNFFGLMSGIEKGDAEIDGVFGLFGGYGDSNLSVAFNAGDTEIDSYFGGVYWKKDYGSHRVHAAFVAGATDNEVTRNVGGMTATGDFDGVFYSPSLTVSTPVDRLPVPAYVSARANYVHLDLDGYTETGIALPLTVGDRDVSIINLRGQLNLPQYTEQSNGDTTRINWAIGVDATIDAGSDDVAAIVAATPFGFGAKTEDEVAGFVGLNLAHTSADGMRTLGINGELQSAGSGNMEATGEVSVSFRF